MAFIHTVPYAEATGRLRSLYDRLRGSRDWVDHIVWIHSVNPRAMEHHLALYGHAMRGPSSLTRVQREMVAVTVSAANDCFY